MVPPVPLKHDQDVFGVGGNEALRRFLAPLCVAVVLVMIGGSLGEAPCYKTSDPQVDTGAPLVEGQPRYYVIDGCFPLVSCMGFLSVWVYEESNGIDGLQRDDVRSDVSGCDGAVAGDTIII